MRMHLPRRRVQFTLQTLLLAILLAPLTVWIGSEALVARKRVGQRERLLHDVGAVVVSATRVRATNGTIDGPLAPGPPEPSRLRRWLGDQSLVQIVLRARGRAGCLRCS